MTDLTETRGGGEGRHAPEEWNAAKDVPLELERAWPITRACSTRFRAVHSSGIRPVSAITLLVVHCTEGVTAAGAAAWFANPDSGGSAHVVVDALECYRTLEPRQIAWGAPGVNGRGWHLELAGYAHWTRKEWLHHERTLERGAYKLALHAEAFGIPLKFLTDKELRGGHARGVVSHREVSRVYGGDHSDPGANFPWGDFLGMARACRSGL